MRSRASYESRNKALYLDLLDALGYPDTLDFLGIYFSSFFSFFFSFLIFFSFLFFSFPFLMLLILLSFNLSIPGVDE